MEAATTHSKLRCVVVTPERAVLDEIVDFIALPMYDGELGVLPGRTPLIGRLGTGDFRIRKGKVTQHYFVDGGFVQIRSNVVTVLTSKALPAEELSVAAAEKALAEAHKVATTPEAIEAQLKAQQKARVQKRLAQQVQGEGPGSGH